ncbi:MFS transporter [Propionicicella superfundia]|uniref:MFS transporter n=1 Tax=Propionicicella superfundia TaxID=348582 RepID=UPI000685A78F|nr:MFS transporter [Propionicicella superfundia]
MSVAENVRLAPSSTLPTVWAGHPAGTAGYRRLVFAVMAGGFANFSLMYFVQPLLPVLAARYSVSAAESAHVLSITTLTIMLGLLVTGPLADRIGRVAVMRWSLLASGVLGLAAAFAPTWGSLLVLRGLLGVTLAGLPGAALAYLREEVHPAAHARANALYITGTGLGGAAGRLLPGLLAALGGWPLAAAVMSLLTLGASAAMWLLLPPSLGFAPRPVRLRDAVLGTLLAPRERVIALLCLTGFAAMGTFVGVYNAVPFRLQAPPFGLGAAAVVVYLIYPVGSVAPLIARALSDRIGRGLATATGLAVLVASIAVTTAASLPWVIAGLGGCVFAFLGVHSLLSGWVVDKAKRSGIGTAQASGAYLLLYYLGSTVFGAVATQQWQTSGWSGVETVTMALATAGVVTALIAAVWDRNPRRARTVATSHV